MLELATAALRCTGELVSHGLQTHRKKILTSIQRLKPVLVPYPLCFDILTCAGMKLQNYIIHIALLNRP